MVAVGFAGGAAAFEVDEVVAVAFSHEGFDGGVGVVEEVEDPEGAAGAEGGEAFLEHEVPLGVGAEVVEGGGGDDDVGGGLAEVDFAHVALEGGEGAGGVGADALEGAGEHGEAEVDEGAVDGGGRLGGKRRMTYRGAGVSFSRSFRV